MTGKDIMEALSFADDKFIQEAQEGTMRKKSPIRYLAPLAACLCLMTPVKAGGASEDHVPAARTTQHNISTMNGRKDEAEETEDKV